MKLGFFKDDSSRPLWWRLLAAILAIALASLVRFALTPILKLEAPYIFFSVAVIVTAWYGGFVPALLALALGLAVGDFFFTEPLYTFAHYSRPELALISDYLLSGAIAIGLFHLLHKSRARVMLFAAEAARELEERKKVEEALRASREQLQRYAGELEARVAERTASLRQSLGTMEEMLHTIAHNLRAPNRAMQGFAHLLETEHGGNLDEEGREFLSRIARAAVENDKLIGDLLEYGRVTQMPLPVSPVALGRVIQEVVLELQPQIRAQRAQMHLPREWPAISANHEAVRVAARNLLSNALKFMRPGVRPEIRIWAEEADGYVRLHIRDNGLGIPAKFHRQIFLPFQKLDPASSAGTGMGLALVRRLIERLGGQIWVQSTPGMGTTFTLVFPASASQEPPSANANRPTAKHSVLAAD